MVSIFVIFDIDLGFFFIIYVLEFFLYYIYRYMYIILEGVIYLVIGIFFNYDIF